MRISKLGQYVREKHIFYAVLGLNIILLLSVKFYPTLDGPAHLYNSNLLAEILRDSPVSKFYSLNTLFIPNWTGHFILLVFNVFLPGWLAEKALLLFYLLGVTLSFRLLVKQLNPEQVGLSIFIFPFAYSFLFYLGFYNYSLSFIFLFLSLCFWIKAHQQKRLINYLVVFVSLVFTYYSAILTFFFAGLCMGLFTLAYSAKAFTEQKKSLMSVVKNTGRELLNLFIVSLPLLVFSYIFIGSVSFAPASDRLTLGEQMKWLLDVRCLIVYNYSGDAVLTRNFLYISLAVASVAVFMRLYRRKGSFLQLNDFILLPFLLALLLFFIIPTSANAGMMSDRFCLLLYILLIMWLSVQTLPKTWGRVFMGLIVILHIGLLFKHHNGGIRNLNSHAVSINSVSDGMKDNSLVLPVNMSDNWLELHFSNYLGVDKPLVILENYEASVGWFPVRWNMERFPRLQIAGADQLPGINWLSNVSSTCTRPIDYVFLYGNLGKLQEEQWVQMKDVLNASYNLVFSSADNYIALYEVKK